MRLLIVGSLEGYITSAGQIAMRRGAKVAHVDDAEAALKTLRSGRGADLLMVDVKLDVAALIEALKAERISVAVVACGIGNDTEAAVAAIRAGAKEYVPLPPDAELIAAVLAAVAEDAVSFIARDPAMTRVLELAEQVAPSEASVLITGESGTGKEVMARHIHERSKRAQHTFISLNCAAIPDNLLESELFGHEKGAFTGAVARRIGKFEEASGGTLLLDEVSEMHPRLQAKLLRAVQEHEIDRLGGGRPIKVDIRLIATSNRDLEAAVREGSFREDLYFRLNVVNVHLPPLRERPQDIEALAEHFARKYAEANGVETPVITPQAREALHAHGWRGNVRELENAMHRAVLLARDGHVTPEALLPSGTDAGGHAAGDRPAAASGGDSAAAAQGETGASARGMVGRTVAEVERDLILETLQHCLGNRTHAANILGISIRTLRNKLRAYNEEGVRIPAPGESERAPL